MRYRSWKPTSFVQRREFIRRAGALAGSAAITLFASAGGDAADKLPPKPPARARGIASSSERVQLGEDAADGPTWVYANQTLRIPWRQGGGDWIDSTGMPNGAAYSAAVSIDGTSPVTIDVTAIVGELSVENTGILLHGASGGTPPAFASRESVTPPTLAITTDHGLYSCPCVADTWIAPSSNQALGGTLLGMPGMLKFDLSSVIGSVQKATLILALTNWNGAPFIVAADYLDMPIIVTDPASQLGGARSGIASAVADDRDLVSHPAIILYSECTDEAAIRARWTIDGPGFPGGHVCISPEFVQWPEAGMAALRMESQSPANSIPGDTGSAILAWRASPAGGQRYSELYTRYLVKIDPDVDAGMTAAGVRLPGFEGDGFSYRMAHLSQSAANPQVYRLVVASDDATASSIASVDDGADRMTSVCLRSGRIYSIEQHVKLNSIATSGAANPDGIIEIFVDGVQVYADYQAQTSATADTAIGSIPFAGFHHGSSGPPRSAMHYEFSGIATSAQYIGPPRQLMSGGAILLPFQPTDAWWKSLPLNQVVEIPNTAADALQPQLPGGFVDFGTGGFDALMTAWSGAAFDAAAGRFFVTGGGHLDSSNNALLEFSLETMGWKFAMLPSVITSANIASAKAAWGAAWIGFWQGVDASGNQSDMWFDRKPTAVHTYSDLVWTGAEVLRGGYQHLWHIKDGVPSTGDPTSYNTDVISLWDAQNKVMIRCKSIPNDYWDIRTYDPAVRKHTKRPALSLAPGGTYNWDPSTTDPLGRYLCAADWAGREFVVSDGARAWAINADTWAQRKIVIDQPLGERTLRCAATSSRGYEFLTVSGNLHVLDPSTGKITKPPLSGMIAPPALTTLNGVFGRFRRYLRGPVEVLALLPSTGANLRLVRIA